MATPDEMRARLAEARSALRAAIEAAAPAWGIRPEEGEGEDAWSPRQAAEHAIGGERMYTTAICVACGYPGVERVRPSFETAADAIAGLDETTALCDSKLKYVTEKDLLMTHERLGNVESIMAQMADHLREHAEQIKAVAAAA